jgi:hypothetical protein
MRRRPSKWRIDTLDGRGGLAFASWRVSNLETGTALSDCPTFYFSPPAFTPLPVASSATALTAERYGFQLGLLDQKGEVPFDSVEDVAEFVRRIYIGSGRSDGGDGGGPTPVPSPTGEPPEPGPDIEDLGEGQFGTDVSEFIASIARTLRGASKAAYWHLGQEKAKDVDLGSSLIFRGAELTLIEMLTRFPLSKRVEDLEAWETAASRLAAVLVRIGVLNFADGEFSERSRHFCQSFLQSASKVLDFGELTDWSREYPVTSTLMAMARRNPEYWWRRHLILSDWPTAGEPLEDLAHFPISKIHASAIRVPDLARASVADLLSSVLASPTLITKAPNIGAILLFAVARIVSFDTAPWISVGFTDGSRTRNKARLARLTAEADKWLNRELPRLNFSPSVEQLIESPPSDSTESKRPIRRGGSSSAKTAKRVLT